MSRNSRMIRGLGVPEGTLVNSLEVEAVGQILEALQSRMGVVATSAVLTPYRRQVRKLRFGLGTKPQWARLPNGV